MVKRRWLVALLKTPKEHKKHCFTNTTCPPACAKVDAGYPSHNALSTPPITSDRKPTQPTTRHSRRGGTGRERPDVEADVDEGGLRFAGRHRPCGMRRSPAAAPDTPPSNKTQSTGSCAPARGRGPTPVQDHCAAPHGRLLAAPGPRPCRRPPRRRSPSRHVPTHQHRPGSRPGLPCPVPACSGQPLPGERRFSSALGNRV